MTVTPKNVLDYCLETLDGGADAYGIMVGSKVLREAGKSET